MCDSFDFSLCYCDPRGWSQTSGSLSTDWSVSCTDLLTHRYSQKITSMFILQPILINVI